MTEVEFFSFLIDIMFEARKNKRFGRDWAEFERRWAPLLVVMMWEMYEKTYRVDHNYSFLTSVPKWREIFATIAQGRMSDLVVCSPLSPYIEAKLHPRTFNNRKKKGATAAIDQTIEDVCEPYLLQNGYINRTPRGRVATPNAYAHMHREVPESC